MMNNNTLSHIKRRALVTAIACAYMSLAISPAYASDTEIYVDTSNASAIAPNLMMMFDTSGSMKWCINAKSPNKDGEACNKSGDLSRMATLKKAMNQLLNGDNTVTPAIAPVPGYVKMGLSRYHATTEKGGYVLYPVRPLDALVAISPTGVVESLLTNVSADAIQQSDATSSGTNTSGDLKIGLDGTTDYVSGFQFGNVMVPKGATITNAYVELTAKTGNAGLTTWEIAAEATGDASNYGSQINSRTYGGVTNYSPDTWLANEVYKIPVTAAINEVVNRADWCGGNALSLRIKDISAAKALRTAYSANTAGSDAQKPNLVVSFSIDPEKTNSCIKIANPTVKTTVPTIKSGTDDATWQSDGSGSFSHTGNSLPLNALVSSSNKTESGFLFKEVQIPKGATIVSASLIVTPNDQYKSNSKASKNQVADVRIYGFSSPDVDFCPSNNCISAITAKGLALTSAANSVVWNTPGLTKDDSETINVTDIVKEIVEPVTWASGKTIGFKLYNNTSTSEEAAIYSYNGSSTKAPRLDIKWTAADEINNLSPLETVREQIVAVVNGLGTPSGTPLGAAFSEASRYMYGLQPYNTATGNYDSRTVTNAGTNSVTYISPISEDDNCSANYVFLLTDGDPLDDANVVDNVKKATDVDCTGGNAVAKNWNCMKELATYNNGTSTKSGAPKKRLYTSTMILGPLGGTAETNMTSVAALGGGKFYKATDTGALAAAFTDVINEAMKASGTISAAGVAVNQLNRLNHLDQLFYAVFDPRPNSLHWEGNLKRYRLGGDGSTIYDDSTPPKNAVDKDTGFFKKDAKSFWSTTADGDVASEGGAASKLPVPTARNMFTYTGALTKLSSPVNLTKFTTPAGTPNSDFTDFAQTKLGSDYTKVIEWYKGFKLNSLSDAVGTSLRKRLGGALHSRPILVNYGYTGGIENADNAANQTNYVFFSTLEGTLHAIDANTGEEKFSFIPGEKLGRLKDLFLNPASALPEFGMDLTWVSYRKDYNYSGQIQTTESSKASNDKVWLYGGMRMGGKNYYALDVTDITTPKLMFGIEGGTGKYKKMGQTWSEPVITDIYVAGKPKKVMIFGGGYDMKHETATLALPFADVDEGNQVYIVDAEKGDLLWKASGNTGDDADLVVADMKFSIPSSPKAIDLDGDGVTDVIYVGDLGGQVFRIDLDKKAVANAGIAKRVRLIAKVGQTESATLANQRRFYEPPAVATFKDSAGQLFATVAMGSGYRSRPLNAITDERFYTFFDKDVVKPNLMAMADADLQAVITTSDLAVLDLNSTTIQDEGVDTTKKGWFIDYPEAGEKSLASGFIFSSRLVFSTYSPVQSVTSNCSPVKGQTNLYTVCMPYGKLCATTKTDPSFTGYKKSNTMAGLGGEPQLMLIKKDDGTLGYTVLTGTTLDAGIFSDLDPNSAKLVPSKKWREKSSKD